MNHSIHSADRSTHLKVVVVALVAGVMLAGFGLLAKSGDSNYAQAPRILKAGQPVMVTTSGQSAIR
jgi:hypothetical protein